MNRSVLSMLMSGIVVLAGLYVALTSDLQVFGWVLVAVGLLGLATAFRTR